MLELYRYTSSHHYQINFTDVGIVWWFVCLQRAHSERFPAVFDMIDCNDPVVMNTLIDQVKIRTDYPFR